SAFCPPSEYRIRPIVRDVFTVEVHIHPGVFINIFRRDILHEIIEGKLPRLKNTNRVAPGSTKSRNHCFSVPSAALSGQRVAERTDNAVQRVVGFEQFSESYFSEFSR